MGAPAISDFQELQKTSKDFKRLPKISKNFQKFPPASGPGRRRGMAGRGPGIAPGFPFAGNPLICLDRTRNELPNLSTTKGFVGRSGRRRVRRGSSVPARHWRAGPAMPRRTPARPVAPGDPLPGRSDSAWFRFSPASRSDSSFRGVDRQIKSRTVARAKTVRSRAATSPKHISTIPKPRSSGLERPDR